MMFYGITYSFMRYYNGPAGPMSPMKLDGKAPVAGGGDDEAGKLDPYLAGGKTRAGLQDNA